MRTPVVQINRSVMVNNLKQIQARVAKTGVELRPHIKTHKSTELANLQLELGAKGITCAKLDEMKVMIDGGIDDIFLAYPLADEEKISEAIDCGKTIKRLIFSVDTLAGARLLSKVAAEKGVESEVRIEIETGLYRTGFTKAELQEQIDELKSLPNLRITGIYTYRASKNASGAAVKDTFAAGVEEATLMVEIADFLREAGLDIQDVSVGSTPTVLGTLEVEGITEVRTGTYIFNDAMQVAYEVCTLEDCAAAVLVTVVSVHGDRAVIDGGSKTFATDVQPTETPVTIRGFGIVKGKPEIVFSHMNEEHGVLMLNGTAVSVGEVLEVIPNHVCSTINLHDSYRFDDGTVIETSARGKVK